MPPDAVQLPVRGLLPPGCQQGSLLVASQQLSQGMLMAECKFYVCKCTCKHCGSNLHCWKCGKGCHNGCH